MTPGRWVALGATLGVLLLLVWMGGLRFTKPFVQPVSNPGLGIDTSSISPPRRFDWTDE